MQHKLKNQWNDSMQILFINIVILIEKQNNWNDILQYRAGYRSLINITVQYK